MDVVSFLQTGFEFLGAISISFGGAYLILRYFSQKLFENYLSRSLEEYRSQLERDVITHQIKFQSLHQERADITREMFTLISKLVGGVYRFTITFSPNQFGGVNSTNYSIHLTHLQAATDLYNQLMTFIAEKEIYFGAKFIVSIRDSARPIAQLMLAMGLRIEMHKGDLQPDSFFEPDFFMENNLKLNQHVESVKALVAAEFRSIIGISN